MLTMLIGNALDRLDDIEPGSVRACITSPPYWKLRDYGPATVFDWPRIEYAPLIGCPAFAFAPSRGQLGQEKTPTEFIGRLVAIFRKVRNALADDGTVWVNLGDSYVASQSGSQGTTTVRHGKHAHTPRKAGFGLPKKNLIGTPWRLAFALQADGWILRSDVIWHKTNPAPCSAKDRPTPAHEHFFILSKLPNYHFDADAIAEPMDEKNLARYRRAVERGESFDPAKHKSGSRPGQAPMEILTRGAKRLVEKGTRNKRSVWTFPTGMFDEEHDATFPPGLIDPAILASSKPGDLILDPFGGAGTTAASANAKGRRAVIIEPNQHFADMAGRRPGTMQPGLL